MKSWSEKLHRLPGAGWVTRSPHLTSLHSSLLSSEPEPEDRGAGDWGRGWNIELWVVAVSLTTANCQLPSRTGTTGKLWNIADSERRTPSPSDKKTCTVNEHSDVHNIDTEWKWYLIVSANVKVDTFVYISSISNGARISMKNKEFSDTLLGLYQCIIPNVIL